MEIELLGKSLIAMAISVGVAGMFALAIKVWLTERRFSREEQQAKRELMLGKLSIAQKYYAYLKQFHLRFNNKCLSVHRRAYKRRRIAAHATKNQYRSS